MFIMSIVAAEPVYKMTYNNIEQIMMYDADAETPQQFYAKSYDACIRSYLLIFPPEDNISKDQQLIVINTYLAEQSVDNKKFLSMQLIFLAVFQNLKICDNNGHVDFPLRKFDEYSKRINNSGYPAVMVFYLNQYFDYYVMTQIKQEQAK